MVREVEAPHCLDHFSLSHGANHEAKDGPLESLCRNPFDGRGAHKPAASTVQLMPGVDALDLYETSVMGEAWKDGQPSHALVPRAVVGWEFYSLLWPQPDGTSPLRLSADVELLVARPPGGPVCPSLLFAYIPAEHQYGGQGAAGGAAGGNAGAPSGQPPTQRPTPSGGGAAGKATVLNCERLSGNLDLHSRTKAARIVALCPATVYKDTTALPDEHSWGLFIGPRSRSLVLLNRHRGRIDIHLATLLGIDASFRLCSALVGTLSRLFEPFGTQDLVPQLFGQNFDPLKVHSGLTNATVADHVSVGADGREDYQRVFGVRLPHFFLSNASCNLCFLTPSEAQLQRAVSNIPTLVQPGPLPDVPRWTLDEGHMTQAGAHGLYAYRDRVRPLPPLETGGGGGFLQNLLDLDGGSWLSSFGAHCAQVAFGAPESFRGGHPGQHAPSSMSRAPQGYDGEDHAAAYHGGGVVGELAMPVVSQAEPPSWARSRQPPLQQHPPQQQQQQHPSPSHSSAGWSLMEH